VLRDLGFGAHESAVIIALNRLGSASVASLSSETGIHHANLYAILEGLAGKGLVVSQEGRPRIYQFAPLSHMEEMLTTKVKQLLQDLKEIHDARDKKTEIPTLIYTIRGETDVLAKMQAMIDRASASLLIVAPNLAELGIRILDSLRKAARRGVKIRAILGERAFVEELDFQQRIKEDTTAIDIVADSQEAMISMPDLSICGWADNPLISFQLEGFLQQTWENARKV
jgi:sugar-specific transcriptional regulator TrmB